MLKPQTHINDSEIVVVGKVSREIVKKKKEGEIT